jgi:cytosine/adenosine deaminase-related metal-dependent hydrolase
MINKSNLTFLSASWIVICDKNFTIIKDGAIVFNDKIIAIDTKENLQKKYPNIKIVDQGANSVLMPGLINSHIHLEFSSNKTHLRYGNFMDWLYSLIEYREILIENSTEKLINNELTNMMKNGTTTIGAISSYGFDLESCVKSPLNVVYFTEVIGNKADMIDTLFIDFKERLSIAKKNKSDNFIPAIAIHSPYSVHPFLIREVLNIAKDDNLSVSAHFQESKSENSWLNYSKGEFKKFFKIFLQQSISTGTPSEFLQLFKGIKKLSFTHCVEANQNELNIIKNLNATIIHCPNSNRLLNNTKLNFEYIKGINMAIGTDGLSSNNSLNMFDELRSAFFIHTNIHPNKLSKQLLQSATIYAASALGLNKGLLEIKKDSDIITFTLPNTCFDEIDLATHIILHTKQINKIYIQGINIEFN